MLSPLEVNSEKERRTWSSGHVSVDSNLMMEKTWELVKHPQGQTDNSQYLSTGMHTKVLVWTTLNYSRHGVCISVLEQLVAEVTSRPMKVIIKYRR